MSRRRLRWAAAVLVLAAGCGVPVDARPRPISGDRVPFDLLDPDPRPAVTVAARPPATAPEP